MTAHDPDAETDEWITHPPPSPASTLTNQQMLDELVRRGTLSIEGVAPPFGQGRVRLTSMRYVSDWLPGPHTPQQASADAIDAAIRDYHEVGK